jgi:hypothetical protein
MKAYGGTNVKLHSFLTSRLDESECQLDTPGRFASGKVHPRYSQNRGVDGEEKDLEKDLFLFKRIEPRNLGCPGCSTVPLRSYCSAGGEGQLLGRVAFFSFLLYSYGARGGAVG